MSYVHLRTILNRYLCGPAKSIAWFFASFRSFDHNFKNRSDDIFSNVSNRSRGCDQFVPVVIA